MGELGCGGGFLEVRPREKRSPAGSEASLRGRFP